jgi:hypothetical protein
VVGAGRLSHPDFAIMIDPGVAKNW